MNIPSLRFVPRAYRRAASAHSYIPWWLQGVLGAVAVCGTSVSALAQTSGTPINPISSFQVREGSSSVTWSQTNASVDVGAGTSTITYADTNNGTSTMVWQNSSGALTSWIITPAGGATQIFTDATAQGQPGSFVLTSGAFGSNNVLSINGHAYVPNGSFLSPARSSNYLGFAAPILFQFGYAGATYSYVSTGTNYNGVSSGVFSNGTTTALVTVTQGVQIYFSDGTQVAYAIDPTQRVYTYQTGSTATSQLNQINGVSLTASGNTVALPLPRITSFVWEGTSYTFSYVAWNPWNRLGGIGTLVWCYVSGGSGSTSAASNLDGSFGSLSVGASTPNYHGENIALGTIPNTFNIISLSNYGGTATTNGFTEINGVPYVVQGSTLVPQGPVNALTYGGNSYQFTGYAQAGDGNWLAQYSTGGSTPYTAWVEYVPGNDAIVKMSINAATGGTAVYVDGATVGQPGAYVWSNTSTATNALTMVNNASFNAAGDSDLSTTATAANGVFQIKGNFMSLGSWSNNANQSGVDLSYYDGSASVPSTVEFTSNRPLTTWDWDAASADGTAVNPIMQLDQDSRLLLYPTAVPGATSVTGPKPSVILDPSINSPSDFSGVVRFEGPVRIAPQGDLSMGTFIQDGFQARPTQ